MSAREEERGPQAEPRTAALAMLREEIWSRIIVVENCWEWIGPVNNKGYGTLWLGGVKSLAHRSSWEAFRSKIPQGLVIDHLCRNRRCVNPEHMRVTTARDNTLVGFGPTAINHKKTHCKRGHELSGDNLVIDHDGYRDCRVCIKTVRTPKWTAVVRERRKA